MAKQFLKKKSKRQPARLRYKIEKKVRDHKKKLKKQARKNGSNINKKKKDPGIPNSLPFKENILKEAEDRRARLEAEQQKKKEKRKKDRERARNKSRNLEGIVKDAQKRTVEFERKKKATERERELQASGKATESSLKTFYKEFRKVVDAADVLLEVLDARDPLGSRCAQMEETIISSGTNKRLVLVLNKIDLVPRENVEAWIKHLKNEFPVIAFKASTQTQADNLRQTKMQLANVSNDLMNSSHCIGADLLMKLLGNYCRNKDIKTNIRVGVVGFPNTGKSSIINSLKRSRACTTGSTPGLTRNMQEVQLDKHITLLDSPGVVMAKGGSDTSVILRNCVKVETVDDPVQPVEAILKRCSKQQIMMHYKLSDYHNVGEFLALLAKRLGKLKKGGVPDSGKAAKSVLQDWMNGRITYYTEPPEQHTLPSHISADFVTEMGKEFNIDNLQKQQEDALKGLQGKNSKHMLVETLGAAKIVMKEDDLNEQEDEEMDNSDDDYDEEVMDDDEDEDEGKELVKTQVSLSPKSKSKKTEGPHPKKSPKAVAKKKTDIVQLNKDRKLNFKKMKKQRRRADKVAGNLSDALTGALSFDLK